MPCPQRNNLPAPQSSDISQLSAWQQQKLFINDRPLSEAIVELNRYRNGRIVVPDAKLNNQRITGVFSLVNPDETLHTLSAALALQQTNLGPWWVVLHR
jgi:transmembrane sensor